MRYTKAVECDWCGRIEVSVTKKPFKLWFKFIGWFDVLNGNGTTNHFCSEECVKLHKEDIKNNLVLTESAKKQIGL